MSSEPYPNHKCGAVQDFCTFHDTKIYFCIYCKKVISAKRDPVDKISIVIDIDLEDRKQDEYDPEQLKDWI